MTMFRSIRVLALVAGLGTATLLSTAAPALALPASGGVGPGQQVTITSVTVGRHDSEGFDRVVWTIANGLPTVSASYVTRVLADPSGNPVPLLGSAFIAVSMRNTTPGSPQPTLTPAFLALRQLKGAGDFEAVTAYGIGQASRRGFRVFTLTGPNRVVLDVAR
jgi:hypothetical protein